MLTVSPTQSEIQVALRAFLLGVLPAGTEVVEGQDNRVPEPAASDFVVFWTLRRQRIETNVDTNADVRFTGSIAGQTLTVTAIDYGTIAVNHPVFGVGVTAGTIVTALGSGTGGVGTYTVNNSQSITSRTLAAGQKALLQPTMVVMQLDVHGPKSADNVQIISTAFRDEYAVTQFKASNNAAVPLYADDPKQVPFLNGENQYETRWVVEAAMQANQVVPVPQEFADIVTVGLIEVDTTYPL